MAPAEQPSLTNRQAIGQIVGPFKSRVAIFGLSTFGVGLLEAAFLVVVTRSALAITNGERTVGVTRGVSVSVAEAVLICSTLLALRLLMSYATVRVQTGLQFRIIAGFRRQLGRSFLQASWNVQSRQPPGALQQLVVQFPANIASLIHQLSVALAGALSLFALLIVALTVSTASTLIMFIAVILLGAALSPLRSAVRRRSKLALGLQVDFSNRIAELSDLSLEVSALGVEEQAFQKLSSAIDEEAKSMRRVGLMSSMIQPVYTTFAYIAILMALWALSRVATESINEVGAVMLIMLRSLGYGSQIQQGATAISQFAPFAERLVAQQKEFQDAKPLAGDVHISEINTLSLGHVSFGYENDQLILDSVDFEIHRGEVVGIVGESGSGKTTLIHLLLGLQDPNRGSILVNEISRSRIHPKSWNQLVAYVPQETRLLSGTIDDNVKFLRDHVTDTDVDEALEDANLLLPAERFPVGKYTDLGVAGRQFSGGQKQRLAIARALATHPSVLVLDEPTSSLDVESENVIVETMSRLKGSVTTIVVTHRESTLRACDRIFVVDQGTVIETTADRVTPDQLDDRY